MASCSFHAGNSYAPTVTLSVWETGHSTSANTSNVSYELSISRPSNVSSSASKNYSVTINGSRVKSGSTTIGGSGKKVICSGSVNNIAHNSDGSKTISFSFSLDYGLTWDGVKLPATATGSGSLTLTKIPRKAPITLCSGSTFGQKITVKYTPPTSAYTYKMFFKMNGYGWVNVSENSGYYGLTSKSGEFSFTIPLSEISKVPSGGSISTILSVSTYSGSTYIGDDERTIQLKVPANAQTNPKINSVSVNEAVAPFVKDGKEYILQGFAEYKFGVTASDITYYYQPNASTAFSNSTFAVKCNGTAVSASKGTAVIPANLMKAGSNTLTITVTDVHGLSATAQRTVNVVPYFLPYFTGVSIKRAKKIEGTDDYTEDVNGKSLKIIANRNYASIQDEAGNELNAPVCTMQYRLKSASIFTDVVEMPTNPFYIDGFEESQSYVIRLNITDACAKGVSSTIGEVATAIVGMHIKPPGTAAAFGKYPEHDNMFELPDDWGFWYQGAEVKDHIVEYGKTGIWYYQKWRSGMVDLWGNTENNIQLTGFDAYLIDLPFEVYNETAVISPGFYLTENIKLIYNGHVDVTTHKKFKLWGFDPTTNNFSTGKAKACIIIKGYWK